jgi:DNA-binding winged helix-turn-helix (wHTH) protein
MFMNDQVVSFGVFELFPPRRLLLKAGRPLPLGSRAFDILNVLIERAGEIVSKDELISRVWPETFVEETNLRVHIAALRKVLFDDQFNSYITNVPGR